MGMFSYVCSDSKKALLAYDTEIKARFGSKYTKTAYCLIPKEFGGGSFKVHKNYDGYGVFYDKDGGEHDVYVEMAKWNGVAVADKQQSRCNAIELYFKVKDENESPHKKGNYNLACTVKYPLKIVEKECAYEDAEPCWDDRNQGWGADAHRAGPRTTDIALFD